MGRSVFLWQKFCAGFEPFTAGSLLWYRRMIGRCAGKLQNAAGKKKLEYYNCGIAEFPHGIQKNMKNEKYNKKELRTEQELLINIIEKNRKFSYFVESNCHMDKKQIKILCEIFSENSDRTREEWINQIYLYGSMVRGRDLLARQIFLWLFEMTRQ